MSTSLEHSLQVLQARWIAGAGAPLQVDAVPQAWQPLLDGALGELAVLALAAQCRQFLAPASAPPRVQVAADFPVLTGQLLDDPARLLFRRVCAQLTPVQLAALLQMLATRGWMAHPFDWSPPSLDDEQSLPALYDTWRAWMTRHPAHAPADAAHPFGTGHADEDWALLAAGEQRRLLRNACTHDRAQARALFVAHALPAPAAQRLALLEVLGESAGVDDLPLLESLATDRSDKVRQLAGQLRARLGHAPEITAEQADEIRAWFAHGTRGILRRAAEVGYAAMANATQRRVRDEAIAALDWNQLASALSIEPLALARDWRWDADDLPTALLACAARSGGPDVVMEWAGQALFAGRGHAVDAGMAALQARLEPSQRDTLAMRCLAEPSRLRSFQDLWLLARAPLPQLTPQRLFDSACWRVLLQWLQAADSPVTAGRSHGWNELHALACLLPRDTARAALERLDHLGYRAADHALDALRLNLHCIPLEPSSVSQGLDP